MPKALKVALVAITAFCVLIVIITSCSGGGGSSKPKPPKVTATTASPYAAAEQEIEAHGIKLSGEWDKHTAIIAPSDWETRATSDGGTCYRFDSKVPESESYNQPSINGDDTVTKGTDWECAIPKPKPSARVRYQQGYTAGRNDMINGSVTQDPYDGTDSQWEKGYGDGQNSVGDTAPTGQPTSGTGTGTGGGGGYTPGYVNRDGHHVRVCVGPHHHFVGVSYCA